MHQVTQTYTHTHIVIRSLHSGRLHPKERLLRVKRNLSFFIMGCGHCQEKLKISKVEKLTFIKKIKEKQKSKIEVEQTVNCDLKSSLAKRYPLEITRSLVTKLLYNYKRLSVS